MYFIEHHKFAHQQNQYHGARRDLTLFLFLVFVRAFARLLS